MVEEEAGDFLKQRWEPGTLTVLKWSQSMNVIIMMNINIRKKIWTQLTLQGSTRGTINIKGTANSTSTKEKSVCRFHPKREHDLNKQVYKEDIKLE